MRIEGGGNKHDLLLVFARYLLSHCKPMSVKLQEGLLRKGWERRMERKGVGVIRKDNLLEE